MEIKAVFTEIERLTEKYISLLEDIGNIESKSDDKEGVDKVGAYLYQAAKELGYFCRCRELEKAGNVYSFTLNPEGEGQMIVLSGHMDTVFPKGVFGTPPIKRDETYLYGPGVQDCKGGIAIFMLAMEALKNCGYTDRPVRLILQSDEEVSSSLSQRKSIEFMLEEAKGCAAFLNGEGHTPGVAIVARKGIVKKRITVKGKATHAGWCTEGVSAIKEAAYKVIELEKENESDGITFNCGLIRGGTAINTVPEYCEIDVEYRFKTVEQQKKAEERFCAIVKTSYVEGTESTWEELSNRVPMERTEQNVKLVQWIASLADSYGLESGEWKLTETAGGSDAAYLTLAGYPTVDEIGAEGSGCHSTEERVLLSSLPKMAKLAAAVILNFPQEGFNEKEMRE